MQRTAGGPYKAGELAQMAGVTVRTLHHYDELGLLKPSAYSDAGYRLYSNDDLVRLSHITALRCIGMPLKDIKDVLDGEQLSLAAALALQRRLIVRKRDQLDAALRAIDRAAQVAAHDDAGRIAALREVMQAMNEQQQWDWVKEHYTPEQLERLAGRYDPALQAQWSNEWATLMREVQAAKHDDRESGGASTCAALECAGPGLHERRTRHRSEPAKRVCRPARAGAVKAVSARRRRRYLHQQGARGLAVGGIVQVARC